MSIFVFRQGLGFFFSPTKLGLRVLDGVMARSQPFLTAASSRSGWDGSGGGDCLGRDVGFVIA